MSLESASPQESNGLTDTDGNPILAVERERELRRATPKTADVLHEFRDRVTYGDYDAAGAFVPNPEGQKFVVDLSDPRARAKAKEMRRGYVRKMVEVQHAKSDSMATVAMVDQRGERRLVNEKLAESTARSKGFREASALASVRVLRTRVDERQFCPECGSRWSWCECAT